MGLYNNVPAGILIIQRIDNVQQAGREKLAESTQQRGIARPLLNRPHRSLSAFPAILDGEN
jgi:hypothetical protein